ncbi:MAG: toll/interleukin-1 receptor domain-containing protein [Microbacteriaceae bacterium]|nr:toll/interleukin-1 receptor domain-containing protein [Microbacteriaceae bacterium]
MTNETSDKRLRVFLCHSSSDKPTVRRLYKYLSDSGFDPWLDEEKLLPGYDWQMEIPKAVRAADAVVICLSKNSINKAGYIQREISFALDVAEEQPEGQIYLIPARLEECDVPFRLRRWQWVDLFANDGGRKLLAALGMRGQVTKDTMPAPKMDLINPYGDAEPIPSISILEEDVYYSKPESRTASASALSASETEKLAGEFHKIAIPVVGALSGFGAALSFRVISESYYSGNNYSMAALAAESVANSDLLFLLLVLVSVLAGGGGAFFLNEYYQRQNIPIWFRYLTVIPVFYFVGGFLDLVSCIVIPLALIVGAGLVAAYIYKQNA